MFFRIGIITVFAAGMLLWSGQLQAADNEPDLTPIPAHEQADGTSGMSKTPADPAIDQTKTEPETAPLEQTVYPGVDNCLFKSGGSGTPTVTIYYPSFGKEKVDEDLRSFATAQGADYEKDIQDATEDGAEKPDNYEMWEMTGFYSLERPKQDIISVTFNIYSYSGGAHGNLFIRCLNYNLSTEQALQFSDLFANQEKALEILSKFCSEKLRKDLGEEADDEMINSGTTPELNNFLNLSLTAKGVTVEFQPYQVGPWSVGPQSIAVPLEALLPAQPSKLVWNVPEAPEAAAQASVDSPAPHK